MSKSQERNIISLGDSLAITIPKKFVEKFQLSKGDIVHISQKSDSTVELRFSNGDKKDD